VTVSDDEPTAPVIDVPAAAAPPPTLTRRPPWGAISGTVVLAYVVVWALGLSRVAQRSTFNRWGAALGSLGARVVVCVVVLATLFHSLDGLRRLMAEAVPRTKELELRWRAGVLFVTWAVALPCFAVILWPWVAETTR
jgi:succinate dehydrogenase hydrophobic anchor subunit